MVRMELATPWMEHGDHKTNCDKGLTRLGQLLGNRYGRSAAEVREVFRDCFVTSDGEVSWQYDHIHCTHSSFLKSGFFKATIILCENWLFEATGCLRGSGTCRKPSCYMKRLWSVYLCLCFCLSVRDNRRR